MGVTVCDQFHSLVLHAQVPLEQLPLDSFVFFSVDDCAVRL